MMKVNIALDSFSREKNEWYDILRSNCATTSTVQNARAIINIVMSPMDGLLWSSSIFLPLFLRFTEICNFQPTRVFPVNYQLHVSFFLNLTKL